ncbi:MAG: DNA polymerase Y family protein [Woeseiaceae bacterium]|nr:DNA polymerase Y family protein [Woeseiaceae bacterium]
MARFHKHPARVREAAPAPLQIADGAKASSPQQQLALGDTASPASDAFCPAATSRLWFCAYFPQLALEAGGHGDAPLAVVEDRHGIHRVLLANRAAAERGVVAGQSANAALALLPELELEERSALREQQALESLAAWLERFSSFVSIPAGDLLLLEIAGSLRLFGGLQSLRQQVSRGLGRQGFTASLAIAPTPLAATWLARGGRRACIREARNLLPVLRKLPVACLDWPPTVMETLSGMGIDRVGDCLRLPREGFARRFGAKRLLELDRATGRLPDPRQSWRAPERFRADYEMMEEESDRELLLAICDELLAAHERFLLVRQLGTQRVTFNFYHLKAGASTLSLGCTQLERSAKCWSDLLAIRFERLTLPEPVIAVRLEGGHAQPLQAESGHLRFRGGKEGGARYSMTQLAERLAARMGLQAIDGVTTVAEHRPQQAWRSRNVLASKVSAALSRARRDLRRPLWLLPEPAPLSAEDDCPLHFGRLTLLEGPERLETGWWDDHGIARDYYTAVNPRGMRLWVFRNRGRERGWYLHGIFG